MIDDNLNKKEIGWYILHCCWDTGDNEGLFCKESYWDGNNWVNRNNKILYPLNSPIQSYEGPYKDEKEAIKRSEYFDNIYMRL